MKKLAILACFLLVSCSPFLSKEVAPTAAGFGRIAACILEREGEPLEQVAEECSCTTVDAFWTLAAHHGFYPEPMPARSAPGSTNDDQDKKNGPRIAPN